MLAEAVRRLAPESHDSHLFALEVGLRLCVQVENQAHVTVDEMPQA